MQELRILGLHIKDRIKEAGRTQFIMSEYKHIIASRLGFHELSDDKNSRTGVIVLHLTGDPALWDSFETALKGIGGIDVQKISFLT